MKISYEPLLQDFKMFYKASGHTFRRKSDAFLDRSQKVLFHHRVILRHERESCVALCWYSARVIMTQCVLCSYFYFNLSSSRYIIVFVEVAQTPACQDIESTGFLTRNGWYHYGLGALVQVKRRLH